jgi:hypothetical protein
VARTTDGLGLEVREMTTGPPDWRALEFEGKLHNAGPTRAEAATCRAAVVLGDQRFETEPDG